MLKDGKTASVVVLVASRERALKLRKERARVAGGGLEHCSIAVPVDALADAWAISGDGRAPVTSQQRWAIVYTLLSSQDRIACTPGAVRLVGEFLQRYAGGLSRASRDALNIGEAEHALLSLSDSYDATLERMGLIELGEAACLLSDFDEGSRFVFDEPIDLPVEVERFFLERSADDALMERVCAQLNLGRGAAPVLPEGVSANFSFPTGYEAVLSALRAEIAPERDEGMALSSHAACAVLTPRADELFEMVSSELCAAGAMVRLCSKVAFGRTAFGRALFAARDVVEGSTSWRLSAVDFAYSGFSGMTSGKARAFDQTLRADRLMTCADAAAYLETESPSFQWFAVLSRSFDPESLARIERFMVDDARISARYLGQERGALHAYSLTAEGVMSVGGPYQVVLDLLDGASMTASCEVGDASRACASVLIAPPSASDDFMEGEFDKVVVGDMSDIAYRVASNEGALDVLARKLGLVHDFDASGALRRRFARALRAARKEVSCVFSLRDAAGETAYPACFVDEFVSLLPGFIDAQGYDEDLLGLPVELALSAKRMGEDDLARCLGMSVEEPCGSAAYSRANRGQLMRSGILRGMKTVGEGQDEKVVLSPSAIEAYLSCPYRWFAERRLRLTPLDEGFGAAEKGTFVHAAFAALFDELAERGVRRVGREELSLAHQVLDEVLDELQAHQPETEGTRLAALTRTEQLEVERLCDQIHTALDRMPLLPSQFSVLCHERAISVDDGIDYAGARLIGRIDRVDIDEDARRFAVLDYKGSSAGYAAGVGEDDTVDADNMPGKVQTLIYAQALRRQLDGYSCAAALYLGYRARSNIEFAAGSFDEIAYDATSVARKASCVEMNFDRFLDHIEEALRPVVAQLTAGDIRCEPRTKDACAWCPYERCEGRAR